MDQKMQDHMLKREIKYNDSRKLTYWTDWKNKVKRKARCFVYRAYGGLTNKLLTKEKQLFFYKSKFIFIHIRYNKIINIAKNVKRESVNKVTTPKLIAYDGKMPTNTMIKSKSPEYLCFRICNVDAQIIDWICNWLTELIFQ